MMALAASAFPSPGTHEIPSKVVLPEHRIPVLLRIANDLRFGATREPVTIRHCTWMIPDRTTPQPLSVSTTSR
jgi:hypothetical protein